MAQDITPFCEAAGKLDFSTLYIWQDIWKAVMNAIVPFFIAYMFLKRMIWVHKVFHGLIAFKLIIVAIYAVNTAVTHGHIILTRLISNDPCGSVFKSNHCLMFKVIQTCCMLSMSSTLLLLLLERALSLHPKSSDRICRLVCRAFICLELTVFSIITLQYYALEGDQEWYILHCQEETKTTQPLTSTIGTLMICIDVPSVVFSVALKKYCERMTRRKHETLLNSYRIRYSLTIINAFLPVVFFHGAVLLYNNVMVILSPVLNTSTDVVTKKNYNGLTNIMPYYTVVMPILYLYALKKLRQRRNDEFRSIKEPRLNGKIVPFSEIYHKKLRDAWQTLDALPKQRNSK